MFCLHVYVCAPYTFPQRSEENVGSPAIGIIVACEFLCVFWKLNSCLLREKVLLIGKLSLQFLFFLIIKVK